MSLLIPKNTEEAREIGKKLSRKEILCYWEEYKRSLSSQCFFSLIDFTLSHGLAKVMLKKAFREQMLRETVEGYLGAIGHRSLTRDHIEILLKKGRHYGTVSDSTDRKSL